MVGRDPDNPGLVHIYKAPTARRPLRKLLALRRDLARGGAVRRVLRCVRSPDGWRHVLGEHGPAYDKLPDHIKEQIEGLRARHSIEASFGAALPTEQRLALNERYPDAEHPVVRTHPDTGEKVLFVNAFTTHFTNFHTPDNVRFGQDYTPGASTAATT